MSWVLPVRLSRPSALAFPLLIVLAHGCTDTKLGDPEATGVTVQVDAGTVSADAGAVTVRARAFEDGIALLEFPVRVSIAGGVTAAEVVVSTDPSTGEAIHTFSGLTTAGSGNVVAVVGTAPNEISASAPITIVPGAVAAVALTTPGQSVTATVGETTWSAAATDAYGNPLADAGVQVSTDAPGAAVNGGALQNLRVAGSWMVYATSTVNPAVTDSANLIVIPGAASQAKTSLGQSAVGEFDDVLDVYCSLFDAWGNDVGHDFDVANVSTTAGGTVTKIAADHFEVSGFSVRGPAVATCNVGGGLADAKSFEVVAETNGNTVVANLDRSVAEAGTTLTLSCVELDEYGNPTGAPFLTGDAMVSDVNAVIATNGSGGFTISNLVTKGTFETTCTKGAASDVDDFAVADTTPPATTFTLFSASGPNGITADNHYDPFATLTFQVSATDVVGISKIEMSRISPAGESVQTLLEPAGTTSTTRSIDSGAGGNTFDEIRFRAIVWDTTGNAWQSPDIVITADPAAGFAAASGVTIRTWHESTRVDENPIALTSSNGVLYVKYVAPVNPGEDEIRRIDAMGTASTLVASDFVTGEIDGSTLGMVHVPGGFGGFNVFHTLVETSGRIGALGGGIPADFSLAPDLPMDVAYGTVAATTGIYVLDFGPLLSSPPRLVHLDSTGAVPTTYYDDTTDGVIPGARSLVETGGDLLVAVPSGDVVRFTGAGATHTTFTTLDPNSAHDIAIGTAGKVLVAGGTTNTVYRVSSSGVVEPAISTDFQQPVGLAVDPSGALFVLAVDEQPGPVYTTRIYRVTGY